MLTILVGLKHGHKAKITTKEGYGLVHGLLVPSGDMRRYEGADGSDVYFRTCDVVLVSVLP